MAATVLPFFIIIIPSFWLMFVVPPLWRDVDAYNQTVLSPGLVTILLHAPLYCILSRIPLWFGYLISGAGPAVSLGHFIEHSHLTDAGVFALVFLQHAGLWCGALYLIYAVARTLPVRFFLAVLFAMQPVFYSFAHCIGSETLSMIITLVLAGSGVRIALRYPEIRARDWITFTLLLCCAILTRHINSVLAAVLPITIMTLFFERGLRVLASDRRAVPSANMKVSKAAHVWFMSIATGVIGLLLATTLTHLLCWRAHTRWRSTFGYTFIWRLDFLDTMLPEPRRALLNVTTSKCKLVESHRLLELVGNSIDRNGHWNPQGFIREAHSDSPNPDMKFHSDKFDRVLNEVAHAFLYPPAAPLRSVALTDFTRAIELHEGDIVDSIFGSTDYFFSHPDKMPQCAQLKTFRQPRDRLMEARKLSYFRWWDLLSVGAWDALALVVLLSALVVDFKRGGLNTPVILFAGCLGGVGVVMVFLTCFFARLQPRFTLPMWELTIVSLCILFGRMMDGFFSQSGQVHSLEPNEQPKHSSHV